MPKSYTARQGPEAVQVSDMKKPCLVINAPALMIKNAKDVAGCREFGYEKGIVNHRQDARGVCRNSRKYCRKVEKCVRSYQFCAYKKPPLYTPCWSVSGGMLARTSLGLR